MAHVLSVRNMKKVYFPDILALNGISLDIEEGDFVSIIGPSGCGKTTLLKAIAGIEDYQGGEILYRGKKIYCDCEWNRSVIYQDIRIFPWMTARENILFALKTKGLAKNEVLTTADRWMKLMKIDEYADKLPKEMSKGMEQKVGVCRVLACEPDVILCDEPFSALDWTNREFLQIEILRYWVEKKRTVIFVTHNVLEAVYLGQKIICLTARPGVIKEVVPVDLKKERWDISRDDPKLLEISRYVAGLIEKDIEKSLEVEKEVGY